MSVEARGAVNPYVSRVFELSPSSAVWALRLRYAMAKGVSPDERWVLDAGPAWLHLDRLVEPTVPVTMGVPLLILEGCFVRRWVRVPVEVELSAWSGHQTEVAVRSWQWPNQRGWYFPAAAAALRTLRAEIIAWGYPYDAARTSRLTRPRDGQSRYSRNCRLE